MKSSCGVVGFVVSVLLVLAGICVCIIIFSTGLFRWDDGLKIDFKNLDLNIGGVPTPIPSFIRPKEDGEISVVPTNTLETLQNTDIPVSNPRLLAMRLKGIQNIPETVDPPLIPYQIGDRQDFWISNQDTAQNFQVGATLQYITDHVYFWVQDGISVDKGDVKALIDDFEQNTYPQARAFFGSEWTPGVDGDPHLYILFASNVGSTVVGYFSSADEYHPLANKYSNAHEMFVLSVDNADLTDRFTNGVLAHEFQHMIHWYRDANEETWMNEGFSELAAFLTGYDLGGFDWAYISNPDIPLTDWPDSSDYPYPYYGGAFLFLDYFLNRYGETMTRALVAHPENGMHSVDQVLSEFGSEDPLREKVPTADDLFQDWSIAMFLMDDSVGDGRYYFNNYPQAPRPEVGETINSCPMQPKVFGINQYGVDYLHFACRGQFNLHFEGSTSVSLVEMDPYSGEYAFWSNRGDESDMTLTRTFDFRETGGPITFSYHVWYDLEKDYDYLYLEASTDGGATWEILKTPSGTGQDPSGNSYGWGYNGYQETWISEQVDLTRYAGQQVQLRFEYVTDGATNEQGLLLDDVSVSSIGYFSDFEVDDGGWEAEGFVRVKNQLPQKFRLAMIQRGRNTSVTYIPLPVDNQVEIPFNISGNVDDIVLVVSGVTRFTSQPSGYQISVTP